MSEATITPIYMIEDLIDTRIYDVPEGATVRACAWGDCYIEFCGCGRDMEFFRTTADIHSPASVTAKLKRIFRVREPILTPTIDAESLARKVRDRNPMTASQLLEDPAFAKLAREAAEEGKKFTADLLQWEKKSVVVEAVSRVAEVVAEERKAEARRQALLAAEREAKEERERPTVEAVGKAYEACKFRECKQGHNFTVRVVGKDGVAKATSDVFDSDRYSSSCTYRKKQSVHAITVREDWLERIAMVGHDRYDGRLVLDAAVAGHTADGKQLVYHVTLARQGRGTSLEVDRMLVVADRDGYWEEFHGGKPAAKRDDLRLYSDERIARDACLDLGLIQH